MMLPQTELDALRQAATLALPDQATVMRYTRVQDGLDWNETWTPIAVYPCRVSENRNAREVVIGGQVESINTHTVRLPYTADVTEADRLEVRTAGRTRTFSVTRVYEQTYATVRTVGCSEVR